MDANKLMPDFQAIGKTDFAKPQLNTKDPMWLITAIGAVLMLIFLFLPWFGLAAPENEVFAMSITRSGLSMWPGIIALIGTLAVIFGVLYNHDGLVFCGAVLSAVFALISLFLVFSLTVSAFGFSKELSVEEVKESVRYGSSTIRYGAILHLVVAAITGAAAYLKIAGIKVFK